MFMDFPGAAMIKNLPANAGDGRDRGSIPGLRRSPGIGIGNPVFLPGKFHRQRGLVRRSSWSRKESDVTEHTHKQIFINNNNVR